jgi:hypothetical protein
MEGILKVGQNLRFEENTREITINPEDFGLRPLIFIKILFNPL